MAEIVYTLCALTSALCAVLLIRSYVVNRTPLLLWSAVCFCGLGVSSILLFVDLVVFPTTIDLSVLRALVSDAAMMSLVIGLVWSRAER